MTSLRHELEALGSAEEFLGYFKIDFDPRVVAASRLPILKRFHDLIAEQNGIDDLPPAAQSAAYRDCLAQAYSEFVAAPALTRKVFPRLAAIGNAFVPVSLVSPRRR